MMLKLFDPLFKETLGRYDKRLARKLADRVVDLSVLETLAAPRHDESLREIHDQIDSILQLFTEFVNSTDKDERSEIVAAIKELLSYEPVLHDRETLAQWGDRLAARDSRHAQAARREQARRRAFLKRYNELKAKSGIATQEELAEKTGMSQSYISAIENGRHKPQLKTLKKLAKAFKVPLAAFEIDQDHPGSSDP